jgi:Carboxypeptidase regulatory-like domain/TonB dependent receptor
MRQFALRNLPVAPATTTEMPVGLFRCVALGFVALLVIALMIMPIGASAQLSGTGAISGTVTDSSGAVVANATVTATAVDTNEKTTRTSTGAGDFNITPLLPGKYSLTVSAQGFETYVQENITINALETQAINVKLSLGTAQQTITVTSAPPVLETADATLGAVMDNQMYSSLPLLMGFGGNADQRRSTDFEYLMPGVQGNYTSNNSTDNSGIVNGSGPAGGVSEIYIDGINLPEADQVGDPRFVWTAFGVDSIDQFQVLTSGFSAQYAGQGVENYTVKSGGNQIHGSVYEYLRNTVLDAWAINNKKPTVIGIVPTGDSCSSATLTASTSWCALGGVKATEIQNEYGIVLSGPIIKNKLFLSYNYGQYRDANGPSPQLQTVPTLAMMGYTSTGGALGYADFSGFVAAEPTYKIYDPATQPTPAGGCTGTGANACSRTQFTNNQIPSTRFSQAATYFNKFMLPYEAVTNQALYTNNIAPGYPSGLSNWYQAGRLDYNMSTSNQLSIIVAFGRQASTGPNSSGSANALGPPFNDKQAYTPKTNVDIVKETWTINPHLVNQAAISYGRYYSLSVTPEFAPVYDAANSGLLNLPAGQAAGSFPEIQYSGGVDNTTSEATYAGWNVKANNTYEASDGLQWEHGKHSFNFGGQVVEQQFNYVKETTFSGPMNYTFAAAQTGGFTASGDTLSSTTGISFASYMLGAVNTSSITVGVPGLGSRWLDPSFWGQDDFKLTQKLTLNLGLRWDIYPSINEVHNIFSWLNTKGANNITGNLGTLAFAGGSSSDGFHAGKPTPSSTWFKNLEPRLGLAYAVTPKTVIRASYDLTYARGDWTSGSQSGSPGTVGLAPSATATAAISNAPQFYWDGTACSLGEADSVACGWTGSVNPPAPPAGGASLAEFATTETSVLGTSGGSTMTYFDPYLGSRTPQYLNWTFGLEHQLTNDMSISVSYVGSEGHFISVSKAIGARNNELPESMAALAGYNVTGGTTVACTGTACTTPLLTQKSTAADLALTGPVGFNPPNPYNGATYVASNSVYQYFYPFPQFSGVSDSTSFVGNENWNALEVTLRERPSHGLNFMVNYTYSKSIDDLGTFRVGDNDRLDRSLSTTDEPQNLATTVVYQLPIGRGHWGGDNFVYSAITSDWTVSGVGTYHSGYPIVVVGSGCGGSGILNQCEPNIVPGTPARSNLKYGKTAGGQPISFDPSAATYLGSVQYLNPAAFTVNVNSSTASGQAINVGQGPSLYVPGNASRVAADNLWGMGVYDVDASLKRSFPIYHEWKLSFELDMANITNHVEWASPGATVASGTNASYGTITAVGGTYTPREVQASARLSW